ncbi:hypothetical protein KZ820_20780 [Sphingomonas sp. RRHST34]|uniref:Uncharacterized protein n=1 Tax=Sphingomonas citri TaxID=2862499 RepID=A0ABS7BUA9_9SPHN|nr:hypothetical protein [Sphingomonas citri]MBW6533184.1 hypothetical protein [Sphingomonas citri]
MTEAIERDEVGAKLLELGLCTAYELTHEKTHIGARDCASLPSPWNLPSRLIQYPLDMTAPHGDVPRRIALRHPALAGHPLVQQIADATGVEVEPYGLSNRHGIRNDYGEYHHAVDLICEFQWRELLETRAFTTEDSIASAVTHGLSSSPHDRNRKGYLAPSEARQIMAAIDAPEPENAAGLLQIFAAPALSNQGEGGKGWPINCLCGAERYSRAWAKIVGIERGWFAYDRAGFLQWAEEGRTRYAAGDGPTFTEASGQEAFAF